MHACTSTVHPSDISAVTVLPVATGMALTLSLLALKTSRPSAKYVLWSRIDQKTCLKCILTAGLIPVVVPLELNGDQLCTNLPTLEREIESRGADSILCVLSTTSCFAPRAPDNVEAIARLCARLEIPHIINNAYGVQSADICAEVSRAWRRGRVDAVVQSTDKNFLVPVGGAVIAAGPNKSTLVNAVNASYPGGACVHLAHPGCPHNAALAGRQRVAGAAAGERGPLSLPERQNASGG
ncbi:hypothetical protein CLOM_g29 [Closterium sp. NIES-68]|nr:hypothetical protein CLOM_g29 [Closterium sp. NIES-68]GJP69119.1 hypothetical protein CLOP_g25744 [Closterium sp. NIES-67]